MLCCRNVDPPIWYDTDVKLFEIQRVWWDEMTSCRLIVNADSFIDQLIDEFIDWSTELLISRLEGKVASACEEFEDNEDGTLG